MSYCGKWDLRDDTVSPDVWTMQISTHNYMQQVELCNIDGFFFYPKRPHAGKK